MRAVHVKERALVVGTLHIMRYVAWTLPIILLFLRFATVSGVPEYLHAIVCAVLRRGKSPNPFSSFRPIALTSFVGNVMERLIQQRLCWMLKTTGALLEVMAGLRRHHGDCITDLASCPGRSTEDLSSLPRGLP